MEKHEVKTCTRCGVTKPLSDFQKWRNKCNQCRAKEAVEYRRGNEQVRINSRERNRAVLREHLSTPEKHAAYLEQCRLNWAKYKHAINAKRRRSSRRSSRRSNGLSTYDQLQLLAQAIS